MANPRCCVLRGCGCVEGAREGGLPPPQAVQVDTANGCLGTWFLGPGTRDVRAPARPGRTSHRPGRGWSLLRREHEAQPEPVHARHFWSLARPGCGPGRFPHLCSHLPPTWELRPGRARSSGPGQGGSRFLVAPSGKAASATAAQQGRAHSFMSRRWSAGL